MPRTSTAVVKYLAAFALFTAIACGKNTPLTPTAPALPGNGTGPDGSTLKAAAPGIVGPANNVTLADAKPTLVVAAAAGQFAPAGFNYEFRLMNDAGATVRSATIGGTSWAITDELSYDTPYRWQARAVLGAAAGPWSSQARFFTTKTPLPRVTASSSYDEFKAYFFAVVALRNVGPNASAQALSAMEADLVAVGIQVQKNSGGEPRGRIYLPVTGGDRFARAVDLGDFGRPWQWMPRGQVVCEGIC